MSEDNNIPRCVGIIMDGNRRWAKERELPTLEGHTKGYEVLKDVISWSYDMKISHLVCYAFSTENWQRSEAEVSYLMELFRMGVSELKEESKDKKVNFRFIGQRDRFESGLQEEMGRIEQEAFSDPELTVWLAISYGGRAEIVTAVNAAIKDGNEVTENSFAKLLWTADMPDPDLVIRTSGEERLSNFLPWQSVYSELFFTDTFWPDFSKEEFQGIVEAYGNRKRRKGK